MVKRSVIRSWIGIMSDRSSVVMVDGHVTECHLTYELHQAKRGFMVILKILWGTFQLSITIKVFIDFALIPLKIKYYGILQKRLSRMLDISNCDVIYYVIYVIFSHYIRKVISPLFAWPSSYYLIRSLYRP